MIKSLFDLFWTWNGIYDAPHKFLFLFVSIKHRTKQRNTILQYLINMSRRSTVWSTVCLLTTAFWLVWNKDVLHVKLIIRNQCLRLWLQSVWGKKAAQGAEDMLTCRKTTSVQILWMVCQPFCQSAWRFVEERQCSSAASEQETRETRPSKSSRSEFSTLWNSYCSESPWGWSLSPPLMKNII